MTSTSQRRRLPPRVTIYDVAEHAGVSASSVSRFLNVPETLADGMAARIAQAILDTGYQLRFSASRLANTPETRRHPGLVMFATLGEHTAKELSGYTVFAPLFRGIHEHVHDIQGHLVTQHCPDGGDDLLRALDLVRPDAVLLLANDHAKRLEPKVIEQVRRMPAAWVLREHCDPFVRLDRVFYNNDLVGRMAAEHLISQGARSLAFINEWSEHHAYRRRRVDFVTAAREAGIPVQALEVGVNGIDSVEAALRQLQPAMPEGIFLPADDQAAVAHSHLLSMGFNLETQVRLMGCNHDPGILDRLSPPPATLDLNLEKVGWLAVEQLIKRFNNPAEPTSWQMISPTVITAQDIQRTQHTNPGQAGGTVTQKA